MDPEKTTQKFISAPDARQAQAAAQRYFQCGQEALTLEIVQRGAGQCLALALFHGGTAPKDTQGDFALFYEEEGVYLELYPPRGAGRPCPRERIMTYLKRKKPEGLNAGEVFSLLSKGQGRVRVAPAQGEHHLDEDIAISVPEHQMEGWLRFLPPDPGGAPVAETEVRARIADAGVTFGLDEQALAEALAERDWQKRYLVARGEEPVAGEDGQTVFHFPVQRESAQEREAGEEALHRVTEGQCLAERRPATAGQPGRTVRGEALCAKPGREARLPAGKNTKADETATALYAARDGVAEYAAGAVMVLDVYLVEGDCEPEQGEISFDGSVMITGSVLSDVTVKAGGSIVVSGVVEGARLIAGGSIKIKGGVQGGEKGVLSAGGSISAQFIERATITAGSAVTADVIIHSAVESGGGVYLRGRRASIIGGTVRAAERVVAGSIGSHACIPTEIEVGLLPRKRARMQELEQTMGALAAEEEKLRRLKMQLERKRELSGQTDEAMMKIDQTVDSSLAQNHARKVVCSEEIDRVAQEIARAVNGTVSVADTVHPGVKIGIATAGYRVTEPMQGVTFRCGGSEMVLTSYEEGKEGAGRAPAETQ